MRLLRRRLTGILVDSADSSRAGTIVDVVLSSAIFSEFENHTMSRIDTDVNNIEMLLKWSASGL